MVATFLWISCKGSRRRQQAKTISECPRKALESKAALWLDEVKNITVESKNRPAPPRLDANHHMNSLVNLLYCITKGTYCFHLLLLTSGDARIFIKIQIERWIKWRKDWEPTNLDRNRAQPVAAFTVLDGLCKLINPGESPEQTTDNKRKNKRSNQNNNQYESVK